MGASAGQPPGDLTPPVAPGGSGSERARGLGRALSEVLGAHDDTDPPAVLSTTSEEDALDVALVALGAAFAGDVSGHCRAAPDDLSACRITGQDLNAEVIATLSGALIDAARFGAADLDDDHVESMAVVATGRGSSIGVLRVGGVLSESERRLVDAVAALVRPRVDRPEWV